MRILLVSILILLGVNAMSVSASSPWLEQVGQVPYERPQAPDNPVIYLARQDYEKLERNQTVIHTPITIGSKTFERGLGTHSLSHVRVYSPKPIDRFTARAGLSAGLSGSVVFIVLKDGQELYQSPVKHGNDEAERVDIRVNGAHILDLIVTDAGDGPNCDHANWAEAKITLQDDTAVYLDEIEQGTLPHTSSSYPFSFNYGGKFSNDILESWTRSERTEKTEQGQSKTITTWTDPGTSLKLEWQVTRFTDFPAVEWVLYFENTGKQGTPIISDVQALDISLQSPISQQTPYRLHKTNGAPSNETDFEPSMVTLDSSNTQIMSGGGGRSSNKDLPFFKIETGDGSYIIAVGWSGQWQTRLESVDNTHLRVKSGLELTNFTLHPGERVRSPRMLVMHWQGDTMEANARFRELIYKHYAAKRSNKTPLPTPFCNTCFTRGGGWLNECNEDNQISLIKAYAPLGLEALFTDAGWFEGGWPNGAGNWNPRKDAYPRGMEPVAQAALDNGMIYGLWFEPERVIAGTDIHRNHPEWVLSCGDQHTFLLNFGLPEVQDYFFGIVKSFMDLPGFRVYRQDFNMDPLPFWRANDAPDRQGITEMKYIEGLYAYWDRIARTWPDSFREECASGGRRIDLETVMRMHVHQDSDYWFDNEVDQAQIWGLSQYLPNNVIASHVNRLDDYSFASTMLSSLCLGWIADAPDFDMEQGKRLMDRYMNIRHLLVGAWYPLLPYTRDMDKWMVSQYHRRDLGEGMILALRHPNSPYETVEVKLHGLEPDASYQLTWENTGKKETIKGSELMSSFKLSISEKSGTQLVIYRKVE